VQAIARGQGEDARKLQVAVLLGISFGGIAGGIGTLIGTPPNGVLAGQPMLQGEVLNHFFCFFISHIIHSHHNNRAQSRETVPAPRR